MHLKGSLLLLLRVVTAFSIEAYDKLDAVKDLAAHFNTAAKLFQDLLRGPQLDSITRAHETFVFDVSVRQEHVGKLGGRQACAFVLNFQFDNWLLVVVIQS